MIFHEESQRRSKVTIMVTVLVLVRARTAIVFWGTAIMRMRDAASPVRRAPGGATSTHIITLLCSDHRQHNRMLTDAEHSPKDPPTSERHRCHRLRDRTQGSRRSPKAQRDRSHGWSEGRGRMEGEGDEDGHNAKGHL